MSRQSENELVADGQPDEVAIQQQYCKVIRNSCDETMCTLETMCILEAIHPYDINIHLIKESIESFLGCAGLADYDRKNCIAVVSGGDHHDNDCCNYSEYYDGGIVFCRQEKSPWPLDSRAFENNCGMLYGEKMRSGDLMSRFMNSGVRNALLSQDHNFRVATIENGHESASPDDEDCPELINC